MLRSPNICALYGLVVPNSSTLTPPILVMELCGGGSLAKLLRERTLQTLPWVKRAEIGAGVACGVDFLHTQGAPAGAALCHLRCADAGRVQTRRSSTAT